VVGAEGGAQMCHHEGFVSVVSWWRLPAFLTSVFHFLMKENTGVGGGGGQ
jgi:hypothetical protein